MSQPDAVEERLESIETQVELVKQSLLKLLEEDADENDIPPARLLAAAGGMRLYVIAGGLAALLGGFVALPQQNPAHVVITRAMDALTDQLPPGVSIPDPPDVGPVVIGAPDKPRSTPRAPTTISSTAARGPQAIPVPSAGLSQPAITSEPLPTTQPPPATPVPAAPAIPSTPPSLGVAPQFPVQIQQPAGGAAPPSVTAVDTAPDPPPASTPEPTPLPDPLPSALP